MRLPQGFLVSGVHCGIKRRKPDLGLIYCQDFCRAIGFFTTNANPSYSLLFSKKNVGNFIKAVLVNSGNANCYSHPQGFKDTETIIKNLAKKLGVKKRNLLIASTGIIGRKLPKGKIIKSLPHLLKNLSKEHRNFAQSILTTDTFIKVAYSQLKVGSKRVVITGFAKGAGMISPHLATMLGFILTDCALPISIFRKVAQEAIEESFNSISVDGCMSTNDTVLFLSSRKVNLESKVQIQAFAKNLKKVCLDLATMIVKDAEGATKFIQIQIKGAKSKLEAKKAGLSLSNSNLFKCALYGANTNWGRIISTLGQAGIKVRENISIKATALNEKNINLTIDLKKGKQSWKVYTCDLTPQYVKINAKYN